MQTSSLIWHSNQTNATIYRKVFFLKKCPIRHISWLKEEQFCYGMTWVELDLMPLSGGQADGGQEQKSAAKKEKIIPT